MSDGAVHLTDDELELYALGRLSENASAEAEEHLLVCEACRARLEAAETAALAFRDALRRQPEPKAGFWQLSWFRPALAVAAMVVLVVAISVFRSGIPARLAPVASLQLTATRGELQTAARAAEYDFTLTDVPVSGGPFRLEIVDSGGGRRWQGELQNHHIRIRESLGAGAWFLRLYDASGKLVHEYGIKLE